MKQHYLLALLTAGLTAAALPAAQALTPADQYFTDTPNSGTNMVGYHVMSVTTDPNNYPFGLSFDLGTVSSYTPKYELGVERTYTDFLLAVTGNVGFYGVAPIARPSVVGSRSNGEALRSLLQNLQAMGLIYDNSTP